MIGLLILFGQALLLIVVGGTVALLYGLYHPRRKSMAVVLAAGQPTDPAELGLEAHETNLRLSDGSTTPAWLIDGGRTDGPQVIIVHGFGDSRYGAMACWARRVLSFASHVVVFDQRGQGESQIGVGGMGVREVSDVVCVIEQLPSRRPVVLFGYSMGAGVAIAAGVQASMAVAGVIADGPYRYWDQPVRSQLRAGGYPVQPFMFLAGLFLRLSVRGMASYDRAAHARHLRCPLLVLHGTADPLCPIESAKAIVRAAPRGELVAFEGGGHLDLAEHDPSRYERALAQFFASLGETADNVNDSMEAGLSN